MRYGLPYVLVRWTGLDAWATRGSRSTTLPTARMPLPLSSRPLVTPRPARRNHRCSPAQSSRHRRSRRRAADRLHGRSCAARRVGGDLDAVLVGWMVLYWLPDDGWQRGIVARLCLRCGASRLWWPTPGRRRHCASRRTVTPDTLLDAASSCISRLPRRRMWRGPFGPSPPTLSLRLVCGSSQVPAQGREVNGDSNRIFSWCLPEGLFLGQQLYTLRCIFLARVTSRDNKDFVSH